MIQYLRPVHLNSDGSIHFPAGELVHGPSYEDAAALLTARPRHGDLLAVWESAGTLTDADVDAMLAQTLPVRVVVYLTAPQAPENRGFFIPLRIDTFRLASSSSARI